MAAEQPIILNTKKTWFYYLVSGAIKVVAAIVFRPSARGSDNIPATGPVIVAPTHRSNLDFAFSLFISQRKIFFMAKQSLFDVPLLGRALLALGAFPVTRGSADREAMKAAESVLAAGEALIIFPEGTRKSGMSIDALHDGTMFIAHRTGASVIPVGIYGTEHPFRRIPKVHINVASALTPHNEGKRISRSKVAADTEFLRTALERALKDACAS